MARVWRVSAAKAEAVMGTAFRARFDKQTFYALLKRSPEWESWGEQMVRSLTEAYTRQTTFSVRLARRKGTSGIRTEDVVDANYVVGPELMATSNEEFFAEIGTHLANRVNDQVEELYMSVD
jgi:hypothetical protein